MTNQLGGAASAMGWNMRAWTIAAGLACLTAAPMDAARAQPVTAPNCGAISTPTASLQGASTHIYERRGARELRLHVFPAGKESRTGAPAIVFFYGGGFVGGDVRVYADLARSYAREGYVAILPDYRVYCRDRTTPADAVADGEAALRWIREHSRELGVDQRRLVLSGSSAGGFIAASVGQNDRGRPPVAALVLLNPALDLTFRGPVPNLDDASARAISPLFMNFDRLPPTIALHGAADDVVPAEQSRRYCAAAQAAGRVCEYVEYAGRGHTLNFDRAILPGRDVTVADDVLARSLRFLDRNLAKPREGR